MKLSDIQKKIAEDVGVDCWGDLLTNFDAKPKRLLIEEAEAQFKDYCEKQGGRKALLKLLDKIRDNDLRMIPKNENNEIGGEHPMGSHVLFAKLSEQINNLLDELN